ncbi:efflux RND transporter periplasmic adaptor subunit [Marinicella sp. S1101]|uniref:HlyD family secretion protein n=1 Tax=Marinicella marina TaxID=2996016 RepID=UPI002260CBD4|nr:efflux RND transporter periplasmic adaptor subunit [Marinicella marina]MCX7553309.1 efflux RND transporter periplasmic adaptor subunit [Marinicella marina]MDJ1139041.1 efflux RND transporter periplasmic adaptor subunit [Marinicella marina]
MKHILIFLALMASFHAVDAADFAANGELKALETDNYSPPKIRRIWQYTIAFMAPDGSQVNPGQPVLMFKTDQLKERLLDKQGELNIKQSELKNTEVGKVETIQNKNLAVEEKKMLLDKAQRKAELPKSVIALNEYEENQLNFELAKLEYQHALDDRRLTNERLNTEIDILKANIAKLSAEVSELNESIKSMRIISNRKGIVMHQTDWNNNKYAVGDNVWGGARVTEVADLEQIVAQLEIKENDMSRVAEGQTVSFVLDAYPDMEFTGTIKSLSKVVRTKSKNQPSKILDATVAINDLNLEIMRPGMSIKATILSET